jgi:hypothetical protein
VVLRMVFFNKLHYSCTFLEHIHNSVTLLLKMEFQQSPKLQLQQNLTHEIMNSKQQIIQLDLNIWNEKKCSTHCHIASYDFSTLSEWLFDWLQNPKSRIKNMHSNTQSPLVADHLHAIDEWIMKQQGCILIFKPHEVTIGLNSERIISYYNLVLLIITYLNISNDLMIYIQSWW